MKFFILVFFLLISPIELRRHDNDIYEFDDNFNKKFNQHKHHQNKENIFDQIDDEQYDLPSFQQEKHYPSRKKVLDDNEYMNHESNDDDDDDETNELKTTPKTNNQNDVSDTSTCINKYDIKSGQLIKVKELKNGAHMIRHTIIDKRTLPSNINVKDQCMLNCCSEETCDLSLLSEQPTHDGYKCYLFACNGNCTSASHDDYTIMVNKKYSTYYNSSKILDNKITLTSTIVDNNMPSGRSFFHETSIILYLLFGAVSTIILIVLIFYYCRDAQRRQRRGKNYAVDADYLINGLYL